MSTYIARFNPYSMDDETILSIATGRKQTLGLVLEDLEEMLQSNGETSHLLVAGPRGIGKSFFARYLQIEFKRMDVFRHCRFVLFPEEQSNIQFPSDLVRMLLSQTEEAGKFESVFTKWDETESDWREAYGRLWKWIEQQREQHGKFLLVALVENMDEMMQRFSGVAEGRFREMLERLPCFVLIGATPKADFDRDYNKPLFHAFKKYKLTRWKEGDFLRYFARRRKLEEERLGVRFSTERIALMESKLRAISLFTGGSPRMAAVLSNLLLKDDLFSTADTLRGLIDELTPYYQDLTKSIPAQSRKLFDTLIRAGENLSQTELANKLSTTQSAISRAFMWLQENDYIRGEKRDGSPSFRYLVNDRIYCLYYKSREVLHDQDYSPVWLLADLLVAYYEGDELREKAIAHLKERFDADTQALAEVSLYARGIPRDLLPKGGSKAYWEGLVKEKLAANVVAEIAAPLLDEFRKLIESSCEFALEKLNDLLIEVEKFLGLEELGSQVARRLDGLALLFLNKRCPEAGLKILSQTALFWNFDTDYRNHLKKRSQAEFGVQQPVYESFVSDSAVTEARQFTNAWNLESRGLCLLSLNRFDEAIVVHRQAAKFYAGEDYAFGQAWNLGQIGRNLQELGRQEEAIKAFREVFALCGKMRNKQGQAWSLGSAGVSFLLLGKPDEAWMLLFEDKHLAAEQVFAKFGDAIIFRQEKEDLPAAFALANELLHRLQSSADKLNVTACLTHFFANLLSMKIQPSLLRDICEEALAIFPSPAHRTIVQATLATVEFVAGGKKKAFLERLPPDMAAVVEAIVRAGEL